ncbi:cellulase family glycosylhydrolase, partial [Chloroflexota bacterium]
MRRSRRVGWFLGLILAVLLFLALLFATRGFWSQLLFDVTGEESLAGQMRGGLEWLGNITRPFPDTADAVPVAYAGENPFGVNTFLEQEVEPQKREQAVQMIADAGFHWIRQEFSWEDIEIHGKGDFEDRRNDPYRSAWTKYDQIVDLAEEYDLQIIARLSNPPSWSRANGDEAGAFAPPDDLEDYGDFVETVVRRYKDRIQYWQLWNEPNIYPEWGDRPVDPEAYTELLKVGYLRVKAEAVEEDKVLEAAEEEA